MILELPTADLVVIAEDKFRVYKSLKVWDPFMICKPFSETKKCPGSCDPERNVGNPKS
jgi:hypothetical protein